MGQYERPLIGMRVNRCFHLPAKLFGPLGPVNLPHGLPLLLVSPKRIRKIAARGFLAVLVNELGKERRVVSKGMGCGMRGCDGLRANVPGIF